DVLTVLREKVAFVSGGRDKRGGPILTFPARTNHDRIKQEDLSRLTLVSLPLCVSLSEDVRARGFTVVVDMRGSKWDSVKPVCCLTRLCCCCLSLSQMSEWIAHSKELFMQSVAEVGQNHQHAVDLQTQHQHFTANCMVSVFVSVSGALLRIS
uniref:CRAL-TRIO domain-containing protein n=1 Tax=Xiphophorus couchianus TaxID=32473 RepID=A0A3B5MS55_9TELE